MLGRRVVTGAVTFALAFTVQAAVSTPSTALAACVKKEAVAFWSPPVAAKGARAVWVVQSMHADDWASGGFAAEVIWVGTDFDPPETSWVEIGATQGWEGFNQFKYYTARERDGNPATYLEFAFAKVPVVGATGTFKGYQTVAGSYRGEVSVSNLAESHLWSGHNPNTIQYAAGLEATCGTNRVNTTFVSTTAYLRSSDGAWASPNSTDGILIMDAPAFAGWCTSPYTFRYRINSTIADGCP